MAQHCGQRSPACLACLPPRPPVQFVEKRTTIEERLKEEQKRARHEAEEEALRVCDGGADGQQAAGC